MKVLFWGTPAYAVASLDALVAAGHELVGVVTQPDRRRGRGKALMPSAVKARASELGIPVFTPERIRREPECQQQQIHTQQTTRALIMQCLSSETSRALCWNSSENSCA